MEVNEKTKCPNCGSNNVEVKSVDADTESEIAIPSKEPETAFRCKDCGYEFDYAE